MILLFILLLGGSVDNASGLCSGGGSTHSNAITVISAAVIVILTIIIIIGLMSIVMILKSNGLDPCSSSLHNRLQIHNSYSINENLILENIDSPPTERIYDECTVTTKETPTAIYNEIAGLSKPPEPYMCPVVSMKGISTGSTETEVENTLYHASTSNDGNDKTEIEDNVSSESSDYI